MELFGRALGWLSSSVSLALYALFLYNDLTPDSNGTVYWRSSTLMLALTLLGVGAVWKGKPLLMFLVFFLSFVPIGLYLLGTPGIYKWIGVANLVYFAAAILMLLGQKQKNPVNVP